MDGFKKRKRPQGNKDKVHDDSYQADGPDDPSNTNTDSLDLQTSETLEELIALRKLKRATGGIDLERLNAGDKKKRTKTTATASTGPEETMNADGMLEGQHGGLQKGKDRLRDEPEPNPDDPGAMTRRLVKSNNFTGQTNAVDVDKHMMAYIEEELRKRKGPSANIEKEIQSLDPRDALYAVAEKYRVEKAQTEEGNVTLSASMLTAIPEVDLGIDIRLRNIEETEKAKRILLDERANPTDEDSFAADRFYRARRPLETDADALSKARKEAALKAKGVDSEPEHKRLKDPMRREIATDDQVMDRFKKRQGGKK